MIKTLVTVDNTPVTAVAPTRTVNNPSSAKNWITPEMEARVFKALKALTSKGTAVSATKVAYFYNTCLLYTSDAADE